MSISPTNIQGSASSSSSTSDSQNPNSNHGHLRPLSSPPLSNHIQSLQISPSDFSTSSPGSMAPAAENSGGSSKKVSESVTPSFKKSFPHQISGNHHNRGPFGQGGAAFTNSRGRPSGTTASPRIHPHGTAAHASGRKPQARNANHLLNFQYDPISRPQPRAPPPRRQQKIKPYNKDLFIQANFKFVVLDSGGYTLESLDPDKMLQWDDIICVRYSTPFPVQCPICLEYPLCPQITSCGHIFCFPCVLQYLLMGKEDDKGDCSKRCPLCFVMISPKDLYTIYIEYVRKYSVGDTVDFMLLTRQKDTYTIFEKNKPETDDMPCCNEMVYDSFSKFTFTSDVDLSVREAISELDGWLVKADSGLVDDLEKLPYVAAAMEQLEQRKKYWKMHQASYRNEAPHYEYYNHHDVCGMAQEPTDADSQNKWLTKSTPEKLDGKSCFAQNADIVESAGGQDTTLSSSFDENKKSHGLIGSRDEKDRDSYNFYQAVDGQHLILHSLNMKCLLHHYGDYDRLPNRINGRILQLETVTQTEVMRRRYRFLSHFSLTTTFQLCEIDMCNMLPPDAVTPFMDEIRKRKSQRNRLARKEEEDKIKADVAAADYYASVQSDFGHFSQSYGAPTFSIDDFEALGSTSATSSSPPVSGDCPVAGERKLFSSVTKLGFAAAHDSPSLKIEEHSLQSSEMISQTSRVTGSSNMGASSFANIISKVKSTENLDVPKVNETGKKGKKTSRVLLSTAGGRRY